MLPTAPAARIATSVTVRSAVENPKGGWRVLERAAAWFCQTRRRSAVSWERVWSSTYAATLTRAWTAALSPAVSGEPSSWSAR